MWRILKLEIFQAGHGTWECARHDRIYQFGRSRGRLCHTFGFVLFLPLQVFFIELVALSSHCYGGGLKHEASYKHRSVENREGAIHLFLALPFQR